MCMSPSSLGNCTIYSTRCFCFLYNPYIPSLLVSCPFFAAFSNNYTAVIRPNPNTLIPMQRLEVKGLTKQLWFIILLRSKTYCSTVRVCFLQQQLTYMYMYIVMSCIMVRTELKGLMKKSSYGENLFPCIIASSSAPM